MTTKLRILIGFTVMVVLVAVMAVFGYSGLQTSSNGFLEYRRLARFNVLASDIVASMNRSLGAIYLFTTTDDPTHLDEARKELDTVSKLIVEADPFINSAERRTVLATIQENDKKLKQLVDSIQGNLAAVIEQYAKVLPLSHAMSKQIALMNDQTLEIGNTTATKQIMKAMAQLGTVRSAASRFSQSRDAKDGARSLETLGQLGEILDQLSTMVQTREGRTQFDALRQEYTQFLASITDMVAQCKAFQASMQEVDKLGDATVRDIGLLNTQVNDDMLGQGDKMLSSNENAQNLTLGLSIGGIILAILLSLYTIRNFLRVLRELGVFAGEIARGNFRHTVKIAEKGEVGQMVAAMQQIPDVLQKLITQANELAGRILVGNYRDRIDANAFSGEFSVLTQSINTVSNAYTKAIDAIPLPIIACDLDFRIIYANDVTNAVLGGDKTGERCGDMFKSPVCGTDQCFANCAKKSGQPSVGETAVHPNGADMEIAVTAIPLVDEKGTMKGHLEICTDLTEIKAKQRWSLLFGQETAIS